MASLITDNLAAPMAERGTYQIEPFALEIDAFDWLRKNHTATLIIIADKMTLKRLSAIFDRKIYPSGETVTLEVGDEALLIRRVVTRSRIFGKSVSYFYALCRRLS